jgi:hypothetical protein
MHSSSRLVAISFVLPLVVEEIIKHSFIDGPNLAQSITVSLIAAAWLFWLAFSERPLGRVVQTLRISLIFLATGYLFIAILYLLAAWKITVADGYDAFSELLGSLLFAAAAASLLGTEPKDDERKANLALLVCLSLLVFVGCVGKAIFDFHLNPLAQEQDTHAARLLINVCNGGLILLLYGQLRKLRGTDHPLIHISIIFFAIAEIVAHETPCPAIKDIPCRPDGMGALVALGVAWSLLLGKVVFVSLVTDTFLDLRELRSKDTAKQI